MPLVGSVVAKLALFGLVAPLYEMAKIVAEVAKKTGAALRG